LSEWRLKKIEKYFFHIIHSTPYSSRTMDLTKYELNCLVALWYLTFVIVFCITKIICGIIYSITRTRTRTRTRDRKIEFDHSESDSDKDLEFVSIKDAVIYVLNEQSINTRQDLDAWSNGRCRQKFYAIVKKYCKVAWNMEDDPISVARRAYESLLPGYANSSVHF